MQVDFEFGHLRQIAATLDELLADVRREIDESPDPDGLGVFDRGEALIGLGFVACQNYLVARKKRRSNATYDSGPKHGPHFIARLVNEGANYWKHHSEWPDDEVDYRDVQRRTARVLQDAGVLPHDYVLSNLLGELTGTRSFAALLVSLDAWRSELDPGGFVP